LFKRRKLAVVKRFIIPEIREHEYEIGNLARLGAQARKKLIALDIADPYLDTPRFIKHEMYRVLNNKKDSTHYSRIRGLPDFVKSVSNFYQRKFQVRVDPMEEVMSTVGSGEALFVVFSCIIGQGDECVVPNPSFPAYSSLIRMRGGVVRFVKTQDDFHLDHRAIKAAVTRKTKAIVLCTPNNPTGAVYDRAELSGVLEIARENDLIVISDESYSQVTYDGRQHFSIAALPKALERTIVVNSLSKVYAMTGWRLGYIIARSEFIEQFEKVAYEIHGCVNTAVQYAGAKALQAPESVINGIVRKYDANRRFTVKMLRDAGFQCHMPEGGFEAFPRIPNLFKGSEQFAKYLAKHVAVLVKPGIYFGPDGDSYFRIVYCKEREILSRALNRICQAYPRN
jgi:aminotransferase